jgi:hypothetical protein
MGIGFDPLKRNFGNYLLESLLIPNPASTPPLNPLPALFLFLKRRMGRGEPRVRQKNDLNYMLIYPASP